MQAKRGNSQILIKIEIDLSAKHAESENTQAQEGNLCQFRIKKKKKKEEKALEENFPIRNELEVNNTQISYLEFALG